MTSYTGTTSSGQEFTIFLTNSGGSPYTVTWMSLAWPVQNQQLTKLQLEGEEIWSGGVDSPAGISDWTPGSDHDIGPGSNRDLVLFFDNAAAASGYDITIELAGSCSFTFSP